MLFSPAVCTLSPTWFWSAARAHGEFNVSFSQRVSKSFEELNLVNFGVLLQEEVSMEPHSAAGCGKAHYIVHFQC